MKIPKNIIANLCGGLGNQMFQYAAGAAVATRLNAKLYLDISWYENSNTADRPFLLGKAFGITANIASPSMTLQAKYGRFAKIKQRFFPNMHSSRFIIEPHFNYWSGFESLKEHSFLEGYWQSEEYFSSIALQIKQNFQFQIPQEIASTIKSMYPIPAENSVSVHIRRGDYISNPSANSWHGVCGTNYYTAALEYLKKYAQGQEPLELFLFSDDTPWVKDHFDTKELQATIVTLPKSKEMPWLDMYLMAQCKHHIIANSSFSWWGAWLGEKENSITIAPKKWFSSADSAALTPCPKRWEEI